MAGQGAAELHLKASLRPLKKRPAEAETGRSAEMLPPSTPFYFPALMMTAVSTPYWTRTCSPNSHSERLSGYTMVCTVIFTEGAK